MPRRTGLSVPVSYLRLQERISGEPFSLAEGEAVLGSGVRTRLELSRLTRLGWLLRLARGRYVTADPMLRITPKAEGGLQPFRARCFYPVLHRTLGGILRFYGRRLQGVALFGSAARGVPRPTGDLDLFVLLDHALDDVFREVDEEMMVVRDVRSIVVAEWEGRQHLHNPSILTADARAFDAPGRVMLSVLSDGRIIYDPGGALHRGLVRLRRVVRAAGAREERAESGRPAWYTGQLFDEIAT